MQWFLFPSYPAGLTGNHIALGSPCSASGGFPLVIPGSGTATTPAKLFSQVLTTTCNQNRSSEASLNLWKGKKEKKKRPLSLQPAGPASCPQPPRACRTNTTHTQDSLRPLPKTRQHPPEETPKSTVKLHSHPKRHYQAW